VLVLTIEYFGVVLGINWNIAENFIVANIKKKKSFFTSNIREMVYVTELKTNVKYLHQYLPSN